jgi:serine/threonine-protein kinase
MSTDPTRLDVPPSREALAARDGKDLSGQALGDFQLLRKLGEGGMGQVYLAEQRSLQRRVALKLLRHELAANEVSRRRFEQEALAVAKLTHANIVQVYAVGENQGLLYMALEYVEGRNLRDYLSHKGPPELHATLSILRQAASALNRAAELGIVHRDIKPENILLTRKGEVKITDFGLSRVISDNQPATNLTQTGTTLGTPLYMSPEQVEGRPLDHRTDIYSLGVTCYHLLAGQPPFEGETAFAVAIQHVQGEPLPLRDLRPDLPPEVCAIVAKMMAKRPEERYQTAREILQDLKRLAQVLKGQSAGAEQLLAVAAPPTPGSMPARVPDVSHLGPQGWSRRLKLGVAVIASLVLAIAAGGALGYVLRPGHELEPLPEPPPSSLAAFAQESLMNKEQALRTLVNSSKKPADPDAIRHGAQHRIDLAVYLLKERQNDPDALSRAEKFFQDLMLSPIDQYQLVGISGQAIVLAFQDRPKESNAQFMQVSERAPGRLLATMPSDPEYRVMISRALQRNYENLVYEKQEREFPSALQPLRMLRPGGGPGLPGDLRPRPPAKDKQNP